MKEQPFSPDYRLIDTTAAPMSDEALFPFAYEEVECRRVGNGESPPLLHLWRHNKAFILGLRDRKLPYAPLAMRWLEEQGYAVTVRHSGGAAVPLDAGVVNISIILPKPQGAIDFRDDFKTMVQLIEHSLKPYTQAIQTGEIKGSYCPGDFDLSIQGQKFCGIAQRRQTQAFIVQAFVVVEGSGAQRAKLVQQFYQIAKEGIGEQANSFSNEAYDPQVQESSMASLAELTPLSSAESFIAYVKKTFVSLFPQTKQISEYDSLISVEANQMLTELQTRYDKK